MFIGSWLGLISMYQLCTSSLEDMNLVTGKGKLVKVFPPSIASGLSIVFNLLLVCPALPIHPMVLKIVDDPIGAGVDVYHADMKVVVLNSFTGLWLIGKTTTETARKLSSEFLVKQSCSGCLELAGAASS